ncbi:MAG TPA: homocysteine S-methyltransferase family protein [Jatrophihabitantaceae bacterium]|jgi:S-methylmethionine-dependent homocysteine/selenocysteine methylase
MTTARFVTDGGLETDLIFHSGVDLPHFAAFPLVDDRGGKELLARYYDGYADIARTAGAGLVLEAATWRANPDWGARLGYSATDLDRVNTAAIEHLAGLRERYAGAIGPVLVSGSVGPRGDGYAADNRLEPEQAAEYHRPQLAAFAVAGADLATAYTLTDVGEAIGIVTAARSAGLPVAISFTVETDGRLPSGSTIADAITTVDAAAPPDYFLVNCAHPSHIGAGLDGVGPWRDRIHGVRANASVKSHAELDASDVLDEGDVGYLVSTHRELADELPALRIVGGCCGTDARHVAALWDVA